MPGPQFSIRTARIIDEELTHFTSGKYKLEWAPNDTYVSTALTFVANEKEALGGKSVQLIVSEYSHVRGDLQFTKFELERDLNFIPLKFIKAIAAPHIFDFNNIPIKTIEKNSGVIYAESMSFPREWVDCGKEAFAQQFYDRIGNFNVVVRESNDGKIEARINSTFHCKI